MKKKTKSTTNQNTSATVTPTNPQWVTDSVQGLGGKINDTFANLDPYSLVPGADPLQTQAAQGAAGLSTSPNYGKASDILGGVAAAGPSTVQAGDIQGGIAGFMNPYMKDVVDTSLANFDEGAGYTRAENKLALAGDTTFGGSGGAIQTALSDANLVRGRASTAADLRSGAYDRAAALAAQQAQMQQQASLASGQLSETALSRQGGAAVDMAGVGQAAGADTRANIGTQNDMGATLRAIAAAQAGAPITALGAQQSLLAGLPLDLFKGQNATGSLSGTSTTKESGASLSDWMKLAASAAMAASDVRLKRDIVHLYDRPDGLGVYLYRYLWSPLRYIGVIAQDVLKVKPEAVAVMPNGFYAVDYGKL